MLQTAVIVGRAAADLPVLCRRLGEIARRVVTAEDSRSAMQLLRQSGAELVIIRESFSPSQGLGILQDIRAASPSTAVVVVSGEDSVDQAVRFIRAGAYDFLVGPLDEDPLARLMTGLRTEMSLSARHGDRFFCHECPTGVPFVGKSPAIVKTLEAIRLVAQSRCNPMLLLGETGTGKELAAQAVHAWRFGSPSEFVAVNCAALTASLLESELFGHVKGAFTGADHDKTGLFELAQGGSLLLDEISEVPLELQAKLLRALQERTFRKVGGVKDVKCNATIIASSNRNLLQEVSAGRFRRDLYYRLAIFPITVPTLRHPQRRSDIPLLAEYFIENSCIASHPVAGLSPQAIDMLMAHQWPGNVRELKNVIDRALLLERSDRLTSSSILLDHDSVDFAACTNPPLRGADVVPTVDWPLGAPCDNGGPGDSPSGRSSGAAAPQRAQDFSLEAAEREFILRALRETGWQRTRAAALLGITRATLHAKLKRYAITSPDGAQAGPDSAAGQMGPNHQDSQDDGCGVPGACGHANLHREDVTADTTAAAPDASIRE